MIRRIAITMIALITLTAPAMAINVAVTTEKGIVGKPAEFTITIDGKSAVKTVPVDVVLVMDCSGSMLRWGNIITKPQYVTLNETYSKIGEFTLNETSDVEVMLQKPLDLYDRRDKFRAYLMNKNTHEMFPVEVGYSTVRWKNIPPGAYEVFAKRSSRSTAERIFCVELPPERLTLAKSAAKTFVDLLGEDDRVALVEFTSYYDDWWDYTKVVEHLTDDKSDVKSAIDSLTALHGTPMGYGLQLAIDELNANARLNASKVIILLSDGWWNMGPDPMNAVNDAVARGYKIYTIGYGGADEATLQAIAEKTGGKYYFAANESDLKQIYSQIAEEIKIVARNATLKVELENVTLIDTEPNCQRNGNVLIWDIGDLPNNILNFTVMVKSNREGEFKVADCWFNYTDLNGTEVHKMFEVYVSFVNNPPIINVTGKTEIYEREWLVLTISVRDPDGHSVSLEYNAPIAGIFKQMNSTTWMLKWMPSVNFVESGTRTFTIEFVANDEYNATAKEDVQVTVHDLEKWLEIWPDKNTTTVYEGNTTEIRVYVDSSSKYNVTFDVLNAKEGTYVAMLQDFDNGVIFKFAPQYDLTDSKTNVTVIFEAKNDDGLTANTSVNITVFNVNVSIWAKVAMPKAEMDILTKGRIYVGEPIYLKVTFVNATLGNVTVNGVEIWRDYLTQPVDERTISFVPNTAGEYRIVAWAINGNNATPTEFVPINVSIKAIS